MMSRSTRAERTGAFADKNVGTAKTVTVSGLTLTGTDAANYTVTPPTTTANITPANLTVSGIIASNKSYDGTTDATLVTTGAALAGLVNGDDVTLDTSGATGTFDTPDLGTGKTVTITGLTHQRSRRRQLRIRAADDHRRHHARYLDGHRHHGRRQGLRRNHRCDARHHRHDLGWVSSGATTSRLTTVPSPAASTRRTPARARPSRSAG